MLEDTQASGEMWALYCSRDGRRYVCMAAEMAYVWVALYRELERVLPKP